MENYIVTDVITSKLLKKVSNFAQHAHQMVPSRIETDDKIVLSGFFHSFIIN